MPILVRDLDDGIGVSVTGWGVVTEKEYVDALTKHLKQDHQKFKKYRYCLSDWTVVSKMEISTKAVKQIAWLSKSASIINPNVVIATIAGNDFLYGLSRMAQTLRDDTDWENDVFRNRHDAEAWIKARVQQKYGIDDPTFS